MDIVSKITGDSLSAAEFNQIPTELEGVITDVGLTPSSGDTAQLSKAISRYVANGTFYTDSGSANAYVCSTIGSQKRPSAYTDGMKVEFFPGNANTGASTANAAGLGVKNIKVGSGAGADPSADDITPERLCTLIYDGTNGVFKVQLPGDAPPQATTSEQGIVELATNAEAQAGTDTDRAITPASLASVTSTTTRAGLVELATNAEVAAGTDTDRVPSVSAMNSHTGIVKAWVHFDGSGTVSIKASKNVSSITDNGTGDYTLNFSSNLADANYTITGSADGNGGNLIVNKRTATALSVSAARITTFAYNLTPYDSGVVTALVCGN